MMMRLIVIVTITVRKLRVGVTDNSEEVEGGEGVGVTDNSEDVEDGERV